MTAVVHVGPLEVLPMPPDPPLPAPVATDSVLRRELLRCLELDLRAAGDLAFPVALEFVAGADYFRRVRAAWCGP